MNFADESYVRLFTRDTPTWLRLGFEGQTVLIFLLRKVDRAGVLEGVSELASDVHLVTGVPLELTLSGLSKLLDYGVIEHHGNRLSIPRFLAAQTASKTDKARQRDSRERRLAESRLVTIRDQTSQSVTCGAGATRRDDAGEDVTKYHEPSQPVTPSLAQPNLEMDTSSSPAVEPDLSPPVLSDATRVFHHWQDKLAHPRAVFDGKRRRLVHARLGEFTADELCRAIDGCAGSDFHMGRHAKTQGQRHDDLGLILRDAAHVEQFLRIADGLGDGTSEALEQGRWL